MNNKKEGEYYSQMSYTKMLHCLRNESYRKPQHQSDVQFENPGLMPLVVDYLV